jgi:hypothetical protein
MIAIWFIIISCSRRGFGPICAAAIAFMSIPFIPGGTNPAAKAV